MSKRILIIAFILSFAFVSLSFAAVENVKISGDINTEAVVRDLSLGRAANVDDDQNYLFSQTRLRFDTDLTEGVSATIRLINERIWGGQGGDNEASNGNTDINLDLAYVELKEFLYQPLTVTVGRQELHYGMGLIIGDPDTNQTASASKVPTAISDLSLRKSFDAIRGVLDFAPWTVDLIFAKVDESTLSSKDDTTIIGTNIAYDWNEYSVSELYFFSVNNAPNEAAGVTANDPKSKVYVAGTRHMITFSEHLTLGLEGAYQFGDYAAANSASHAKLSAYAVQFVSEYRFVDDYKTKIGFDYTYLSADNPGGKDNNDWNPLFEDQIPAEMMNIFLSQTGFQLAGFSGSFNPREDITVGLRYAHARKLFGYTGGVIQLTKGPATNYVAFVNNYNKHLGDEVDISVVYDYSEDVQLKLSSACLFMGNVFSDRNNSAAYSIRGGVQVNF